MENFVKRFLLQLFEKKALATVSLSVSFCDDLQVIGLFTVSPNSALGAKINREPVSIETNRVSPVSPRVRRNIPNFGAHSFGSCAGRLRMGNLITTGGEAGGEPGERRIRTKVLVQGSHSHSHKRYLCLRAKKPTMAFDHQILPSHKTDCSPQPAEWFLICEAPRP